MSSVAALPGTDAGLVALRVGQHPEGRCCRIGEQSATGRERGVDTAAGGVMGHVDIEMDAIALRAWDVHLLKPDRGTAAQRVDQRLGEL